MLIRRMLKLLELMPNCCGNRRWLTVGAAGCFAPLMPELGPARRFYSDRQARNCYGDWASHATPKRRMGIKMHWTEQRIDAGACGRAGVRSQRLLGRLRIKNDDWAAAAKAEAASQVQHTRRIRNVYAGNIAHTPRARQTTARHS